jgi:uncharacterized protein (TIGR03435 family)
MRALSAIVVIVASRLAVGQNTAPKPQFEVASIRPGIPMAGQAGPLVREEFHPEHFVIHYTPLRSLIQRAYALENYQLDGPASLATRWDVLANAPSGSTREQMNLML